MSPAPVAVVGAGIAGLACALALRERGKAVVLFDKGRGSGGRTATRRAGEQPGRGWDHGAPGFAARGKEFRARVAEWEAGGFVGRWEVPGEELWTGVPGMSALARRLALGLPLLQGMEVLSMGREAEGWSVQALDRHAGPFSTVVLTAPAPQSLRLLGDRAAGLRERLAAVRYQCCWALLAETGAATPVPLRRAAGGGLPECIEDVVCEGTKPGREAPAHGRRWTVHGAPAWSLAHLEDDPATPGRELTHALEMVLEVPVRRAYSHLWRMARVDQGIEEPFLLDREAGLAWAGDACLPTRGVHGVETAWTSGAALGAAL